METRRIVETLQTWLARADPHVLARAKWALLLGLVALLVSLGDPAPPPRTAEGVAAMLGRALDGGGEVRADDFVWEERGGFLHDAFIGRRVLFLARRDRGRAPADLYRARVTVTRSGQPIRVTSIENVTETTLGDERSIIARGKRAAFITAHEGAVVGITILDLAGDPLPPAPPGAPLRDRLARSIRPLPLGRVEITFTSPPDGARHELDADALVMALGREGAPAALDLAKLTLDTGASNPFGASAQRVPARAADLTTASGELGKRALGSPAQRPFERIGSVVSKVLGGSKRAPAPAPRVASLGDPAPSVEEGFPPSIQGVSWRSSPAPGGQPAPAFATDRGPVRMVAIDTRRVDLRWIAGLYEPPSRLGYHGLGKLPEGEPVVIAFAGGTPEVREGAEIPGAIVDRRALSPLVRGLSSIGFFDDGHVELGAIDAQAAGLLSLKQTADALIDRAGPARAPSPPGAIERSALCLLRSGQLVYVWAGAIDEAGLASSMRPLDCAIALPIATGPGPVGLAFVRRDDAGAFEASVLDPAMSLRPEDVTGTSPRDLVIAIGRAIKPPSQGAASWSIDAGTQPTPAWLSGVHTTTITNLGANVKVTSFAPHRFVFHARAGAKEPATKAAAELERSLADADLGKALAAIGLGTGKRRGARGLGIEGKEGYPVRSQESGAIVIERGSLSIRRAREAQLGPGIDLVELPLIADEGKLRPEAREVGTMHPRGAMCMLADGTVLVATVTFDSDEAATTVLVELGCKLVVALDRGTQKAVFVHRAGTSAPPQPRYDVSVLYALDQPLRGRALKAPR